MCAVPVFLLLAFVVAPTLPATGAATPAPYRGAFPSAPQATPETPVLPHYITLGPWERAQLYRLDDELLKANTLVATGKLASAHRLLKRAHAEAELAQSKLLMLALYPEWTEARARLDALITKVAPDYGHDKESLALAAAAATRVEAPLARLEHGQLHLPKADLGARLHDLHDALDHENGQLADNPAWQAQAQVFEQRLAALEHQAALRAGQTVLVDELARMIELVGSARTKLGREDFDGATSDYAALEEACLAFQADLAEMQGLGFDPRELHFFGANGARDGRTLLSRVGGYLAEARQRDALVAAARDPWRKTLGGDRLRLYGMYGIPTWPGATGDIDVATAAAQELWVFYESEPGNPHERLRHEYHFIGDHLQHHELFREQTP